LDLSQPTIAIITPEILNTTPRVKKRLSIIPMDIGMLSRYSESFLPTRILIKNMKKLTLLISITILGWIGWWLGDHIGIMTAYWVSFIGSLLGVYVGVLINQNYLN